MATLSRTPLFAKPHTDSVDGDRSSEREREKERERERERRGERERKREREEGRVALFRKKLFQSPITKRGNGAEWEREERTTDRERGRYYSGICRNHESCILRKEFIP